MAMSMTDAKALALYKRVWPDDTDAGSGLDPKRDAAIAKEVRQMIMATDVNAAYAVVEWWGSLDHKDLKNRISLLRRYAKKKATKAKP